LQHEIGPLPPGEVKPERGGAASGGMVRPDLRVKICGITRSQQGRAIAQLGASALGFICASQSPRFVLPEQIQAIVSALPKHPETGEPICDRIGVFVNASLDTIVETVRIGQLTGVQLHGEEPPEACQQIRRYLPTVELIKALRVKDRVSLDAAMQYAQWVDTLLLDAYVPHVQGGTGQTIDWPLLQTFQSPCPWFLAGGLTPDNVLLALAQVYPDGIDLSSGVEQAPGDKDLDLVARLFLTLQSVGYQPTKVLQNF